MPQVKYVDRREMPPPTVTMRGAMREAVDLLATARRRGQVLRLEFGPEERSGKYVSRYRAAAKRLGIAMLITAEWRLYRTPKGTKASEPAILYVAVLDAEGRPVAPTERAAPIPAANGPMRPEPEAAPPRLVLSSELLAAAGGKGQG